MAFIYSDSIEKQKAREFVLSHVPKTKKTLKVCSLSADNFKFEELVFETNSNVEIDSFEYDFDAYKNGIKQYKMLKKTYGSINFKHDNIFNVDLSAYDFVFLDLCGTINLETINNIIFSLQNFKGIVFITLMTNRERKLGDYYKLFTHYKSKDLEDFRKNGFPRYIELLCGLKQFTERYDYANKSVNNRSSRMSVYGFKK